MQKWEAEERFPLSHSPHYYDEVFEESIMACC
jgi:hypothetical protein